MGRSTLLVLSLISSIILIILIISLIVSKEDMSLLIFIPSISILFDILLLTSKKENITIKRGIIFELVGAAILIFFIFMCNSITLRYEWGCFFLYLPRFLGLIVFLEFLGLIVFFIGLVVKIIGYFLKSNENH